ncbi:MAG: hypothetical protein GEU90_04150 [Gemmatimonas sp.]|nr:hypothetical protein [Gemmatimonas sp.]
MTEQIGRREYACDASAIPREQRESHLSLTKWLSGAVVERRGLAEGYTYRLPAAALVNITAFVANERRCCPYLGFELEPARGEAFVWLRVTGPPGATGLLDDVLTTSGGQDESFPAGR